MDGFVMAHAYAELAKAARSQVTRRPVDASQLVVSVTGTTVYITGVLRALPGHKIDLKEEMGTITMILKGKPGIAEVVWDVTIRT